MTSENALKTSLFSTTVAALLLTSCSAPEGILPAQEAATTVKMDFFHLPLPDIPLPNDVATRPDPTSATGRRINASWVAPTKLERDVREYLSELDGWGTLQPIVIPFTGPLDVNSILEGHRDADYDLSNDVVYVVNVDPDSENIGQVFHTDLGNGNFPATLEKRDAYWKNDPRGHTISLLYEEVDEDVNGNGVLDLGEDVNGNGVLDDGEDLDDDGVLDPPEDTDADGVLDKPNYLPGMNPAADDLAGRADALMTFYEKQTNTLIVRTLMPLDERTTYAVVVTRRLKDEDGNPVGSPYDWVNHNSQTEELRPLLDHMPAGLQDDEVAFAFTFTTQTVKTAWTAVRDGLYGHGVQAHLSSVPADVDELYDGRDESYPTAMTKPHLVYGEDWNAVVIDNADLLELDPDSVSFKELVEANKYVDYYVVGSFMSPQLYTARDEDGNWLPLNEQRWPKDLDRLAAPVRQERIYFNLSVPRKEVSARGDGEPVPVVVMGHGYTGNRYNGAPTVSGYFAKHGMAVLSIDGPNHGLGINELVRTLVFSTFQQAHLANYARAVLTDRAYNFDHDPSGSTDSGADFWTAYLFHTRDLVRQFALDYMQMVRMVRGFDGSKTWKHDTNGDGMPNLAGDFDGDGNIDIGGGAPMYMSGGSLGGIMAMIMGGIEPDIKAIAPISGGGGFGDMGIRTSQGGAREGFILRSMAPIFTGTLDDDGRMLMETTINDLNDDIVLPFAYVDDTKPWDTMLVENLDNDERDCGFIAEAGTVRTSIAADKGDRIRISFFAGPQLAGDEECGLRDGHPDAYAVVDTFEMDVAYQYNRDSSSKVYPAGDPLIALDEGFGFARADPALRRFAGIGQLVLDAADPGTVARHLTKEPLVYPGTGDTTGAHAMVITTMGDLAVPANTGMTYARAAGILNFTDVDERYGVPENQVLIDNYAAEAVHNLNRFEDSAGNGVHIDVEGFSRGQDPWGDEIPRLDPPLRSGWNRVDDLDGVSTALFVFPRPDGQHGFDTPGIMTDDIIEQCLDTCDEVGVEDPCRCSLARKFDVGTFMFNLIGTYFKSGGTAVSDDQCLSDGNCADFVAPPPERPIEERD